MITNKQVSAAFCDITKYAQILGGIILVLCSAIPATSQDCINTIPWVTIDLQGDDANSLPIVIPDNLATNEYSPVINVPAGEDIEFSGGPYFTITEGAADGPVLLSGPSPLLISSTSGLDLFVHLSNDADCGGGILFFPVEVQCTTCPSPLLENDNCGGGSTLLIVNDENPPEVYDYVGATGTDEIIDCWDDPVVNNDIWFSFIAPTAGVLTIQTATADPTGPQADTQIELYRGCGSENLVACNDDEDVNSGIFTSLIVIQCDEYTPGAVYQIRVDSWNTNTTPFTISVSLDNEIIAGDMTPGPSPVNLVGGNANISAAAVAGTANVPEGYVQRFVLTSGPELVIQQLSDDNTSPAIFNVEATGAYKIHSIVIPEDFAPLLAEAIIFGTATVDGLLTFITDNGLCFDFDLEGALVVVVPPPPPNDNCGEGAIELVLNEPDGVIYSNAGATGSDELIPCGAEFETGVQNDIWFYFFAPETGIVTIETFNEGINDSADKADTQMEVFDACGAPVNIGCNDDKLDPFPDDFTSRIVFECGTLVPGQRYEVRIDGWQGNINPYSISATTSDLYDAGTLTADATPIAFVGAQVSISASADPGSAVIPEGYIQRFVLTSSPWLVIEQLSTDDVSPASFNVGAVNLYTIHSFVFPASSAAAINGAIDLGVTTAEGLLNFLNDEGICADFDLEGAPIDVIIVNDDCGDGAIELILDAPDGIIYSNLGALGTDETISCSIDPNVDNDIWFYFVAPETGIVTIETFSEGTSISGEDRANTQMEIFESCGAPESIGCNNNKPGGSFYDLFTSRVVFDCGTLVAGERYEVRIDGFNGDTNPYSISATTTDFANAGTVMATETPVVLAGAEVSISATVNNGTAIIPPGYIQRFILSFGSELVIQQLSPLGSIVPLDDEVPSVSFDVDATGLYTIHSFVYSEFDDEGLSTAIEIGVTTINELLAFIDGADICPDLDIDGAEIMVIPLPSPSNDTPEGALDIICDIPIIGNTLGANQSLLPNPLCGPLGEVSSEALDVFYTFTADGTTEFTINENLSDGDYQVEVLTEDLLTAIDCGTFFGNLLNIPLGILDAGVYYIRVYGSDFFGSPLTSSYAFTLNCTPIVEGASLSGTVEGWNINCSDRAATISLYEPGSIILVNSYNTTVLSDGSFTVEGIEIGTFDVFVKLDGFLRDGFSSIVFEDGSNDLIITNARLGDLNNDNSVNFLDGSAFNNFLPPAPYNAFADYNCDNFVNFIDASSLNQTFGQTGDNPPLIGL